LSFNIFQSRTTKKIREPW